MHGYHANQIAVSRLGAIPAQTRLNEERYKRGPAAQQSVHLIMICRSDGGRGTSDSRPITDEAAAT